MKIIDNIATVRKIFFYGRVAKVTIVMHTQSVSTTCWLFFAKYSCGTFIILNGKGPSIWMLHQTFNIHDCVCQHVNHCCDKWCYFINKRTTVL